MLKSFLSSEKSLEFNLPKEKLQNLPAERELGTRGNWYPIILQASSGVLLLFVGFHPELSLYVAFTIFLALHQRGICVTFPKTLRNNSLHEMVKREKLL